MAGWDDVSTAAAPVNAPQTDPWDAVSTPLPNIPDTSMISNEAQYNLKSAQKAANDTEAEQKPVTHEQSLDTAMGMPASQMIGSDQHGKQLNPQMRAYLMGAYEKGEAVDAEDFFQSAIPAASEAVDNHHQGLLSAVGEAGYLGFKHDVMEAAGQTLQMALGHKIDINHLPQDAVGKMIEAPFDFGVPDSDTARKILVKTAHGLTSLSPEIAAFSTAGAAGTKVGGKWGGLAAGTIAVVGVHGVKTIAPTFANELAATPDDPNGAYDRAVKKTVADAAATGASFGLFEFAPFQGVVKNILFQALGIQPAVAAAHKATENIIEGKPVGEGTLQSAAQAVPMTIAPLAGMKALGYLTGKAPKLPANLREVVGKKMGKPADQVSADDVAGAVRTGFKDTAPTAQAFHDVSKVTGISSGLLRQIYRETGVDPAQVHLDISGGYLGDKLTGVISDLNAGKVPQAYKDAAVAKGEAPTEPGQGAQDSMIPPEQAAAAGAVAKIPADSIRIPEEIVTGERPVAEEMHPDVVKETPKLEDGREVKYPQNESHLEAEVIANGVKAAQAKKVFPKIDTTDSIFDQLNRSLWNKLDPIQKLPELARARGAEIKPIEDTKLLSTIYAQNIEDIQQNLKVATTKWDDVGNKVVTGESLKDVLDDFDVAFKGTEPELEGRRQDFNDFLISQRYLRDLVDNEGVKVTEEQIARSEETEERLQQKYGKKGYQQLQDLSKRVVDFQRRILENLVSAGVMSREKYLEIITANPNYIPLQRVMDDEFGSSLTSKGIFNDARMGKLIKKIKGSEREEKNVFESIIKNTATALDLAARNRVGESVRKLGPYLPEYIQPTRPQMIKKGTVEIKTVYDPKLRAKLEETAKFLKGDVQYQKSIREGKGGYVLGSYSPMENLVRMRIGSTEGVLAHEIGHMLDHRIGLKEKMLTDPAVKKELQDLALGRLNAEIKLVRGEEGLKFKEELEKISDESKYMQYLKNDDEVLANFFDTYVNAPDVLREKAPLAYASFEKVLDGNADLHFLRDITPSTNRQMETISKDLWGESPHTPPDTIISYENGMKRYTKVTKPMFDAMSDLSPSQLGFVERLVGGLFRTSAIVLRAGATHTVEFIVRNVLRDQHDAFLQSSVHYNPAYFMRGLMSALKHDDLYNKWASSGGKYNSYMALDDAGIQKTYEELFRDDSRLDRYLKNPLKILGDAAQASEQATRIAVFNKAKIEGKTDIEAAHESLEATINFARSGTWGGKVNQYIPFFNAGLQASNKMLRAFKENPKAMTFRAIATITLPSLLFSGYYLYGADDKTRQEYLDIPQWQKDIAWVVKVNGEWKMYPKPFTYGYIFGSMPERMMTWLYHGEDKPKGEEIFSGIVKGLASSLSPVGDVSSAMPPIFKAYIESISNYNFFRGQNIYQPWMSVLPPENRVNPFTSESAKHIGELLGISPAVVENAVQDQFGGVGKYALGAGDQILKGAKHWNGEQTPAMPTSAADTVLLKAFSMRPPTGTRSNSYKEFMDTFKEIGQYKTQSGKIDNSHDQSAYMKKHGKEINQYESLNASYEKIKDASHELSRIYEHKSMSAEQKVEKIKVLEDQITSEARRANIRYHKATGVK